MVHENMHSHIVYNQRHDRSVTPRSGKKHMQNTTTHTGRGRCHTTALLSNGSPGTTSQWSNKDKQNAWPRVCVRKSVCLTRNTSHTHIALSNHTLSPPPRAGVRVRVRVRVRIRAQCATETASSHNKTWGWAHLKTKRVNDR